MKEMVQNLISKLKEERSTRQYFLKLKNELSTNKKQFILELVSGRVKNKSEICEMIEFLEIPIEVDNNYVISIRINEYRLLLNQIQSNEMDDFKTDITKYIAELLLLNSYYTAVMVEKSDDEWIVILNKSKTEGSIIDNVMEKCIVLTKRVQGKYKHSISIGISELCNDILELNEAYKAASAAAANQLIPGCSSVACSSDIEVSGYRCEIRDAMKYIKQNYSKEISVESAAREIYISPSYLMHLFKTELNRTFNDCLTDYRIHIAKKLLMESKYRIYEVNNQVGYNCDKHFSKVFKKVTGMSPSEFLKSEGVGSNENVNENNETD